MKCLSHCFLFFSLLSFTACTTLTGTERCALIGQIQEGTQIGTQTHVRSTGGSVYSYSTPTYNPTCKFPKTEEEKAAVAELLPIAKEKQKKRNKEDIIYWVSAFAVGIGVLLLIPPKPSYRH